MQSVACNAFHSIPERAARWLLHAQDRAGDRIELTQEAFAGLLGVQRTTVNAVVEALRPKAWLRPAEADPGHRPRRAQAPSCECYQRLQEHFDAVIGVTGGA